MTNYFERARALGGWIAGQRRLFHENPELGFDLPQTTAHIMETLRELQIACSALPEGGILAELGSGGPPRVLLRADMDALPMTECSGEAFSSRIPGRMHACGHDAHMAMLLGAAALLKRREGELRGTVVLCFQPAEEIMQGAKTVLPRLDPMPDFGFALHIFPTETEQDGSIACPQGAYMSSCDVFRVTVRGVSAHGSAPHAGNNPLYPAMEMALAFSRLTAQTLDSRETGVLSVCQFQGGSAHNVIPDCCVFRGTLRMMREPERRRMLSRMERIVTGIAAAHGVEGTLEFENSVPGLFNDEELAEKAQAWLRAAGGDCVGPLERRKNMVSEDFAEFGAHMPVVMFELLSRPPDGVFHPGHNPCVRFSDGALWRGAAAYAQVAENYLEAFGRGK